MKQVIKMTETGKKEIARLNQRFINRIGQKCVRCNEEVTSDTMFNAFFCSRCSKWENAVKINTQDLRSIIRLMLIKETGDVKDSAKYVMTLSSRDKIYKFLIKRKLMKKVRQSYYYIEGGF